MTLVLNQWVVVGQASQTKAVSTSSGYVNFTLTYYLEAMLTSQNVATNTSYGKVRARVTRSGGTSYSSSMTASCSNCGGYSGVATPPAVLTTGNFVLYGNDAGESALHLTGTLTAVVGGFSISVDAWESAPVIPRASKATFSSDPLTIGSAQTITTNRKSSSFTHTLEITVGEYTETLPNVGESTTWTPSASIMQYMTSWQMPVTVKCTTFNGTTQIGSVQTSSFTLQVDTNVYKPVLTLSLRDVSTAASYATSGTYIKYYSRIQADIEAVQNTTDDGYYLTEMVVTLGGTTQTYDLSDTAEGWSFSTLFTADIGTATELVIQITDSLGRVTTHTESLTVIPYEDIQISTITLERVNANGDPTDTGEYCKFDIEVTMWVGSLGARSNNVGGGVWYRSVASQTYEDYLTIASVTPSGNGEYTTYHLTGILSGATFASSSQYKLLFNVSDAFSSDDFRELTLLEGLPVFAQGTDHGCVYGDFHVHDRDNVFQYTTITPTGYHWNLLGSASGNTAIAFDSSKYSEIMLMIRYVENSNYTWVSTTTIPVEALSDTYIHAMMPARIGQVNTADFGGVVRIKEDSANIFEFNANRASANGTLYVYAR